MRVTLFATIAVLAALETTAQNRGPSLPIPIKLEIVEASLEKDRIVVVLGPEDAYGMLTVSYQRKAGPSVVLYQGAQWGGSYTLSFNFAILPIGEYTEVQANWIPAGGPRLPRSQMPPPVPLNPLPVTTPRPPETLRDVLRAGGIDSPLNGALNLDQSVNYLAYEESPDLFVVSYYSSQGLDGSARLQVAALEKASRVWSYGTVYESIGSPTRIRHTKGRIYVSGHQSPSAEDTLVLTRSLAPVTTLHGWILLLRPDDTVFYSHSMVHFAPTHPGEVWVYEPGSARDQRLYPNQPYGSVRLAYIETVRKIYADVGEKWFAEHNHHGDPTLFDVSFAPSVISSDDGTSVAFIAHFGSDFGDFSLPEETVLVVCRNATAAVPQCKERPMDVARSEHPTWTDPQLLEEAVR